MRWIVLAIVVCIVPYTWLTLRHRKPEPAYLPYSDTKTRAEVLRLVEAGFRRFDVQLELANQLRPSAPAEPVTFAGRPGGLPPLLRELLIDQPTLPAAAQLIAAPAAGNVKTDYALRLSIASPRPEEMPTRLTVYVRGKEVTLVPAVGPRDEPLPASNETAELVAILPGGTLQPGRYQFTLVTAETSPTWTVDLLPQDAR